MSKNRQIRRPEEKFKIVMASIQGDFGSIAKLCNHYGITQTDYYRWRDILTDNEARLFERGGICKEQDRLKAENHRLREAAGSFTME